MNVLFNERKLYKQNHPEKWRPSVCYQKMFSKRETQVHIFLIKVVKVAMRSRLNTCRTSCDKRKMQATKNNIS